MQPTSRAPGQHRPHLVPRPRDDVRLRPYPGPYAFPYQGPDRPFPERPVGRGAPRSVRACAWLGVVSAVASSPVLAVLVGGDLSPAGSWAWSLALLAVPLSLLWGAVDLIAGRSWQVLATGALAGSAVLVWVLLEAFTPGGVLDPGWWLVGLAGHPITLAAATRPSVRRWGARRRPPSAARAV